MLHPFDTSQLPDQPFGLGLRPLHFEAILASRPPVDWFEVHTENYWVPKSKQLFNLEKIRQHYPISLHGVSLSLGGAEPLNREYLTALKTLAERIDPLWISDHLCWNGINGVNMHELLPLPYTEEALALVVSHINEVQDFLGRRMLIENVSSYLTYQHSQMSEWVFLNEVATQADCHILLDVNNIYVSAHNHHFDAMTYLKALPADRIAECHLAGHTEQGGYLIDTHDVPICAEVWALYREAIMLFGKVPTLIERDANIPDLCELLDEMNIAKHIAQNVFKESECLI